MPLNRQGKETIVSEVSEMTKSALSMVAADSRGVTVDKMMDLRQSARKADVHMRFFSVQE